jgi:hypothetical protein
MSDIDYYQKYLKYKSKYTDLKAKMSGSKPKRPLNPLLQESGFKNEFEKSLNKLDICSGSETMFILEDLLKETNQLNKSGRELVLSHFISRRPIEELVSQLSPRNPRNTKALELAKKLINSCSFVEKTAYNATKLGKATAEGVSKLGKATAEGASKLGKATAEGASKLGKATAEGASKLGRSASDMLDNTSRAVTPLSNLVSNSMLPF